MSLFERINLWHQTKIGLIVFAVLEAATAALFLDWAVTGGSWLDWLCFAILVSGFAQNVFKLSKLLSAKGVRHG